MFLQRFRPSDHQIPSPSSNKTPLLGKLEAAIRNIHTPEIKQHNKKEVFFSERRYLIENTKKAVGIRNQPNLGKPHRRTQSQDGNPQRQPISRVTNCSEDYRQAPSSPRRSGIRQRVWKSTDISSIMRLQEQKLADIYQSQKVSNEQWRQEPRVERYREMEEDHKDKIRKEWLSGLAGQTALRGDGFKNSDAIQITNIEFRYDESTGSNMHSQRVFARERRREQKKNQAGSSFRDQRPNTTAVARRRTRLMSDDNMLAPW